MIKIIYNIFVIIITAPHLIISAIMWGRKYYSDLTDDEIKALEG